MSERYDGGPAFPIYVPGNYARGDLAAHGMCLRDWFAGQAMPGLLNKPNEFNGVVGVNRFEHNLAEAAYEIADAMLQARED